MPKIGNNRLFSHKGLILNKFVFIFFYFKTFILNLLKIQSPIKNLKMRSLKIILGILAALLIIYLVLCTMGLKRVDVQRSAIIDAPANVIFSNVNDMAKWTEWGSWYKQDPNMKITLTDNTVGQGAKSTWESEKLGNGNQEIIKVVPNELIQTKMQFDGWEGYSFADIIFDKISDKQTKVTWTLKGDTDVPFLYRGMMKLMGFEGMIGKDYDSGLANLKALSEKQFASMPLTYNGYEVKTINFPAKTFIGLRKTVAVDAIQSFYLENLPKIFGKVTQAKGEVGGQPCGFFFEYNEETQITDMAAVIPVKQKVEIGKEFSTIEIPAQKALLINYYGDYHSTGKAHEAMEAYIKANNLKEKAPAIEEYITDPTTESDPSKWLTKIYYFIET